MDYTRPPEMIYSTLGSAPKTEGIAFDPARVPHDIYSCILLRADLII
jgi:hypothetical protein